MKFFPAERPYWFVDAKWICGIFFIFCLAVTLLLITVVQLTDENRGPKIAALAIGSMFIRGDSLGDIEEARRELQKQGGVIRPLPNMPEVTITEKDLALSPTEIKLKVFQPLTTQLYYDGIEKTATRFAATPEQRDKFIKDASALRIFTKGTHETLKSRLAMLTIISVLLLLGVVYFSAAWGRFANPGLLLLLVGLPGSFISLMITHPPKEDNGGVAGFLPSDIAKEISDPISQVYYRVAILGIILIFTALVGKIISKIVKHKKQNSSRNIPSAKAKT